MRYLAASAVISITLLSACANLAVNKSSTAGLPSTIGPYSQVTARIMVATPEHVWQAMLNWQSKQLGAGNIRIVHAASGRIVELRWQHGEMRLRDNRGKHPRWHRINREELAAVGIVISPWELSEFLSGHIPSGFQPKDVNHWIIQRNNSHVRVAWSPQAKRLAFNDIKHGRKASLIILQGK